MPKLELQQQLHRNYHTYVFYAIYSFCCNSILFDVIFRSGRGMYSYKLYNSALSKESWPRGPGFGLPLEGALSQNI